MWTFSDRDKTVVGSERKSPISGHAGKTRTNCTLLQFSLGHLNFWTYFVYLFTNCHILAIGTSTPDLWIKWIWSSKRFWSRTLHRVGSRIERVSAWSGILCICRSVSYECHNARRHVDQSVYMYNIYMYILYVCECVFVCVTWPSDVPWHSHLSLPVPS